ncbi:DNA-directed RNA polymerase I subunit RPA34-like [Corythoichthys intestinalis]|uniref:DNA-directed RNA polymerase I subunit RPA34-like n=1 Tax=Corythoichthys intestinalis TaxID=161448 RepID=UPI0025A4FE97|nr:DNA-directed RNA polymerase I subunit RPA34-like [Corythoichthys intestinalis]
MLRDISSSSEDEADKLPAEASFKRKELEKSSTYKCPDDFVCLNHKPCTSTLMERLKSTKSELWLVKAPPSFDPRCLRGVDVNLSGFQTLKLPSAVDGGDHHQQVYNIISSNHATSDLRLLTADSSSPTVGPAFSGLLSICESYGGDRMQPHVIHAPPAPALPPGLKQRFQPFGSKTPITTREAQDGDGKRRKKKKKKKDKHIKTEEEELPIKQEVEETVQERRTKKRKKKDWDDEEKDVSIVHVKSEQEEDILPKDDSSSKKKKKKNKTDDY